MARHHEPNASYYSARYAERKRATQRARDAASGPSPCLRCPTAQAPGSLFCPAHAADYQLLVDAGDVSACLEFARRIYWPEPVKP